MNNLTLTVCDGIGPCGECGQMPEHTYQFSVYGRSILLCGLCIDKVVAQIISVLQKVEPQLAANIITPNAQTASDLRCSRCLDMLAAHLAVYRRRDGEQHVKSAGLLKN